MEYNLIHIGFFSRCRFDGVDAMAEQEEFLPHKTGVKKEIRFTDVSADARTCVRKCIVRIDSPCNRRALIRLFHIHCCALIAV